LKLTRRALALGVVLIALAISFGGTFQIYLSQQRDLASAEQEIREHQAQIADLQSELARWNDPAYVKAQARERLGWVLPGDTGYR
jgi:cell division protein FtsB